MKFSQLISVALCSTGLFVASASLPKMSGPEIRPMVAWQLITKQAPKSFEPSTMSSEVFYKLRETAKQYLTRHPNISWGLWDAIASDRFDEQTFAEIAQHPQLSQCITSLGTSNSAICTEYFRPQDWTNLENISITMTESADAKLWRTLAQLPKLSNLHVFIMRFQENFIPTNPQLPPSLTSLSLSSLSAEETKKLLLAASTIKKLSLHDCPLSIDTVFPPALEEVDVIKSDTHILPRGIAQLKNLKKLIFNTGSEFQQNNWLATDFPALHIDDTMPLSPLLEHIDLSCCQLKTIPQHILQLPSLKHLNFCGNADLEIPLDTQFPSKLIVINLAQCNLQKIPPNLANHPSLLAMDLSNNPLITIDDTTPFPHNLVLLNLSNCSLQKIPAAVMALRRLQSLDIHDNPNINMQNAIDPAWKNSLVNLGVAGCNLSSIPSLTIGLNSLKMLRLDGNPAMRWDNSASLPKSLKYLFITFCGLSQLPKSIASLDNLKALDASGNPELRINGLENLPPSLEVLCWDNLVGKNSNEIRIAPKFPSQDIWFHEPITAD